MTDAEIIRKERERLLASGMSQKDVLRAISGENRARLIKSYRDGETGIEKENTDVQHGNNSDLKSTRKQKKEKPVPVKDRAEVITESRTAEVVETVSADPVVYDDIIQFYADEYVESLDETGLKNLYSIQGRVFSGMVKYINRKTGLCAKRITSPAMLWDLWEDYTSLVYKYNQNPWVSEFCMLLGIHRDTFYRWMNGEFRNVAKSDFNENIVSRDYIDICKRIELECKNGRQKGAGAGNVGMIFLCKAIDGMVETAPQSVYNPVQLENNIDVLQKLGLKCSENSDSLPALTAAE